MENSSYNKISLNRSCRNSSGVKSTCCSSKGPLFYFQHLHVVSQPTIPVPVGLIPSGLPRQQTCTCCTDMYLIKKYIKFEKLPTSKIIKNNEMSICLVYTKKTGQYFKIYALNPTWYYTSVIPTDRRLRLDDSVFKASKSWFQMQMTHNLQSKGSKLILEKLK